MIRPSDVLEIEAIHSNLPLVGTHHNGREDVDQEKHANDHEEEKVEERSPGNSIRWKHNIWKVGCS